MPEESTRGKATKSAPPAASSQTSFPSQNGPMAASTCRRSESVRATKGERIPAPRSKPSSATYMANISAAIANHSSNMGALHAGPCDRPERPRTVGDLPSDQEEEQDA